MAKMLNQEICRKHNKPKRVKILAVGWGETGKFVCDDCEQELREGRGADGPSNMASDLPWHI